MSIRNPGSPVLDWHSSIASAVTDAQTVLLPQDTDAITVFVSSSVFGITTLDTYIQTTPDGGTTWTDMANMGQMAAVTGSTPALAAAGAFIAHFDSVGAPARTAGSIAGGSVIGIQQATSALAAARGYTGVPLMSRLLRIFHKATGTGASDIRTQVYVHNQSNRA